LLNFVSLVKNTETVANTFLGFGYAQSDNRLTDCHFEPRQTKKDE